MTMTKEKGEMSESDQGRSGLCVVCVFCTTLRQVADCDCAVIIPTYAS